MVKTSIIVPVYNVAEYLRECFDSIFDQTQEEIEVIAINDGSTDNSLCILEDIRKEHPEMIIFSQPNKGLGNARNKGMELAKGEFIYFLDADDCLKKNAMEVCYQYAINNHLDVVMFDAETFGDTTMEKQNFYDRTEIVGDQERVISGEEFARKYWLKRFCPSAALIYTSAHFLKEFDLEFMEQIYYEDNEFHCRMMPLAKRVMYIPQKLYRRRYRKASITSSPFDMRHAEDYLQMIRVVDEQRHSEGSQDVIKAIKLDFLETLLDKCRLNDLLKNPKYVQDFFKVALNVCGGDISAINSYRSIEILYQLGCFMGKGSIADETKKIIRTRKKELLTILFKYIPLTIKEKCVGIYGTGKNTERFLDEYQEYVGEINAEIVFIESNAVTGEDKYRNCIVFNVEDIGKMPLECIIIASSRYEEEIHQILTKKYDNKFKIIRLRADLQF